MISQHDLFFALITVAVVVGAIMAVGLHVADKGTGPRFSREQDTTKDYRMAGVIVAVFGLILLEVYVL